MRVVNTFLNPSEVKVTKEVQETRQEGQDATTTYRITVTNTGSRAGSYDLSDTPAPGEGISVEKVALVSVEGGPAANAGFDGATDKVAQPADVGGRAGNRHKGVALRPGRGRDLAHRRLLYTGRSGRDRGRRLNGADDTGRYWYGRDSAHLRYALGDRYPPATRPVSLQIGRAHV